MAVRFKFLVGPANRNSDYAHKVSVIAENHREARDKAIAFRGFAPRHASTWFISADEIDPQQEVLERLAELLKEKESSGSSD